tara:strand:+ start:16434 stop:17585 length:1152 start_codon:yes stop_codon:yes gene_type:complete
MRFPKFTYGQNQIVKDNTTVAPINIITPDMQKAKLRNDMMQNIGTITDADSQKNKLNREAQPFFDVPGIVGSIARFGNVMLNPASYVSSADNAVRSAKQGDYTSAGLNAIGALPVLPVGKVLKNVSKPFKSEINWKNWVKNKEDFTNNPNVIKHLIDIEKTTKAKGTWMKNPDGSPFKGTKEQFVVQQSDNFKKAFPKWEKMFHGSKSDDLKNIDFDKGARMAYGKGFYTTDNIEEARKYAGLLKRIPNLDGKVYELAVNTQGARKFSFNDKDFLNKWNRSDLKTKAKFIKEYKLKYGEDMPDYYLKNAKEHIAFKDDIPDGMRDLNKTTIILDGGYQNKWILDKNNPKSLIGNILFDMNNPNIYKSVIGLSLLDNATKKNKE